MQPQPSAVLSSEAPAVTGPVVRPRSVIGHGVGLSGLAGLGLALLWLPGSTLTLQAQWLFCLAAAAVPMVLYSLLVERVHRRASTGLNWAAPRPLAETIATTRIKLAGLAATWALIALFYFSVTSYQGEEFAAYLGILRAIWLPLVLLAALYVFLVDRYATDPHDELWHFGRFAIGDGARADGSKIAQHLRSWAIKAFFLAFTASLMPSHVQAVVTYDMGLLLQNPIVTVIFVFNLLFLIDVTFGTLGYAATLRPLDTHIRSPNPFLLAWVAALICYPPIILMGYGGPLDYRQGTQDWAVWMQGSEPALWAWSALLSVVLALYAWATVIFGLRFSNLTHRGIITNGPYRFFRHPAYLAKNLFWWLVFLPFLPLGDTAQTVQNCLLLLSVNLIYWLRARTEERHLREDPVYRAYLAWMAEHGLLERVGKRLFGKRPPIET
ncbi:methyltransferase family protein [Algihabitans albus]|uniref:methyltransferase family protein n=1 Tax=Algihabitans albus TaxID=2164067 RepID=UPI000E5D4556|nr:isoprenylcysteine carboxylmethyltransferase family protein [Algihabitans albus]